MYNHTSKRHLSSHKSPPQALPYQCFPLRVLSQAELPDYQELHQQMDAFAKEQEGQATDSDPILAAKTILKLAALPEPPLRLILSDSLFDGVIEATENKIAGWKAEESLSRESEKLIPMPEGYLADK